MKNTVSKGAVLIVVTVASFVTPFLASCLNIALPSIGREFSMDAILLSWVATSYILATAVFLIPFGRMADIYGRKRTFAYGTVVITAASLLLAVSNSPLWLISLRAVQGIGNAMTFSTGMAILTSVFPVQERGKVLGINVAAVYLGLSLGPYLGGLLTQHLGWRSILWVNVPLGLGIISLVLWKLRGEWAEARGEKFDLTGSVIYGSTLIIMMYGLSMLPAMWAIWLILMGALGILVFIRWEMRVTSPVFNIRLFKNNATFIFSNLAALINYSATYAVTFLLSLYLQYTKGLDPQDAGLILVSQPMVMAILSPLAGRLSDRIEPRIVASIGMALTSVGLALFAFFAEEMTLGLIVASLIILGFGFALFSSPNTNAVMSSVEKRYYGVATATLGTMRLTGNMLSMGIIMVLFVLYMGRVEITPEYYPLFLKSVKVAFTISAALCSAGIFASLARGKVR